MPLRQLEREVDALRGSDDRFARVGDTLTQQEGDTPPARIIAAARPPVSPSWPRRSLILAIAAAAGACFGAGAALLRDGQRVRSRAVRSTRTVTYPATPPREPYWTDDEPVETPRPVDARANDDRSSERPASKDCVDDYPDRQEGKRPTSRLDPRDLDGGEWEFIWGNIELAMEKTWLDGWPRPSRLR